jgi:excisionase family DNA binding protein
MGDPKVRRDVLRDDPLLLTPEEAAQVLRLGRTTIYALIKEGALRPIHIGRSCRISRAELESYVNRLDTRPLDVPPRSQARRRATTGQRGLFDLTPPPPDAA